jgi:hypothetical protein
VNAVSAVSAVSAVATLPLINRGQMSSGTTNSLLINEVVGVVSL